MRTKVEEQNIETSKIDTVIYKAFNTASNTPTLSAFSFEEVVPFLERRGYKIVLAKGMASTTITETIDFEVQQRNGGYREVENVFARKDDEEIPIDFTSDKAISMLIKNVFIRELKSKLLYE
jgi:hypothetical protein